MTFYSIDAAWWPYVFIFLAASLPTLVWRWLGVLLVADLDENSQWIVLVRCISTALVSAVVAQFIFHPSGAIADISLIMRLAAACIGFGVFLWFRNLLVALLVGEAVLLAAAIYQWGF